MFYTHSMTNPVRALPMRVASYRLRADSFRKGSGGSSSLLHPRVLQKRVQGPLARIIAFRTPPLIHPSLPKQPSRDVHVPTDGYHLPGGTASTTGRISKRSSAPRAANPSRAPRPSSLPTTTSSRISTRRRSTGTRSSRTSSSSASTLPRARTSSRYSTPSTRSGCA